MRMEEFLWNEPGYVLVCTASRDEGMAFADAYLRRNVDTEGGILSCIRNYKTGFLRKKMTITELLVDQRPRSERAAFKQKLEQNLAAAGLADFKYRAPNSMGSETLIRWSCLYAALTGSKKLLVRDDGSPKSGQSTAQLVEWLKAYCAGCSIVWVSASDAPESLARGIFQHGLTHLNHSRKLWHLQNGSLTELDREEQLANYRARLDEERRRQKAARQAEWAAKLKEARRLADAGDYPKALDLCEPMVAEGSRDACLFVCDLWENSGDDYKSRLRAEAMVGKCSVPSVLNKLAKKAFADAKMIASKEKVDEETRSVIIHTLEEARKWYSKSASLGDAEGCYRAAELHLTYEYSRDRTRTYGDDRVVHLEKYSYTEKDAIPYIKQLFAMQESGKEVSLQLAMLSMRNDRICRLARSQYDAEKQG